MNKLVLFFRFFLLSIFVFSMPLFAKNLSISKTRAEYPFVMDKAFKKSINQYLERFIGGVANQDTASKAQIFLNSLYSIDSAKCSVENINNHLTLLCKINPMPSIKKIIINKLPASLLATELRRRLPVQIGQMIQLNDEFTTNILLPTKERVETFLVKNGFYDSVVTVSYKIAKQTPNLVITIDIEGGNFIHVNEVSVAGKSPLNPKKVMRVYKNMCFSLTKLIDAASLGTFRCYSRELENDTTARLEKSMADMGFVQSRIRVFHEWVNPNDPNVPTSCQNKKNQSLRAKCINLKVDIDSGPKVQWIIRLTDGVMVKHSGFLKFISSIFFVDYFSRASTPAISDEIPLDRLIVENELENEITLTAARNVDEHEIKASVNAMENLLINKGYANAKVFATFNKITEDNIQIVFEIQAGFPYRVETLKVEPEYYRQFIKQEALNEILPSRSFAYNGSLSYSSIDEAKHVIEAQLYDKGFIDVKVEANLQTSVDGSVDIIFHVSSKERKILQKVHIEGGFLALNEKILASLFNCDNLAPKKPYFSNSDVCQNSSLIENKIENDRLRILDFYRTNGYLYAEVISELLVSGEQNILFFKVYDSRFGEGDTRLLVKQSINSMIISGNDHTNEGVIRRLFPLDKGSGTLTPISLKQGIANLRESGRFSRIDHKMVAGEHNSDDVYFVLQLTERPSLSLDAAAAFSTDQLFSLEANLSEANLFSSMLRLETSLQLGFFWGRESSLDNEIIWPFIMGKPLKLTINAPYFVYKDQLHSSRPRRLFESRIGAKLELRATSHLTPYVSYSLSHIKEQKFSLNNIPHQSFEDKISSLDGMLDVLKAPGDGRGFRGFLVPGLDYVRLDNLFEPRFGMDLGVWLELSGGILVGSPPFSVIGNKNIFYLPMGPFTWAFKASWMRGFIDPTQDNWEELRKGRSMIEPGGDRTLRGYAERFIGITSLKNEDRGVGAGYLLNNAKVELRFPLSSKKSSGSLSGAIVVDQAMLVPCSDILGCFPHNSLEYIIKNNGFGLSVGAALRYNLPVGPISLEYAFSPIHYTDRVHLLFGGTF